MIKPEIIEKKRELEKKNEFMKEKLKG